MNKIVWFVPAINGPLGGVRVILDYNKYLNEEGIESEVFHFLPNGDPRKNNHKNPYENYDFKIDYFGHQYKQAEKINAGDTLIISEVDFENLILWKDHKRVLFAQNWHGIEEHILSRIDNLNQIGIKKILTISDYIQDYITWNLKGKYEMQTLKYEIYPIFKPAKQKITIPKILLGHKIMVNEYRTRKGGTEIDIIRHDLAVEIPKRLKEKNIDVEIGYLRNTEYKDVPKLMQQYSIYVHLGIEEGYASPPLEAAACGLYLIGFDGKSDYSLGDYGKKFYYFHFDKVENGDIPGLMSVIEKNVVNFNHRILVEQRERDALENIEYVKNVHSKENVKKILLKSLKELKIC
jgi:hypothetical protein